MSANTFRKFYLCSLQSMAAFVPLYALIGCDHLKKSEKASWKYS